MDLNKIAERLVADVSANAGLAELIPGASTCLTGGTHAIATAMVPGLTLAQARSMANQLQASPVNLEWRGKQFEFVPEASSAVEESVPAGNCYLELLENDDTRFLHFWVPTQKGRVKVLVELVGRGGPSMSVIDCTRLDSVGRGFPQRIVYLRDEATDTRFVRNRFEAVGNCEATGYAYWPVLH